MKDLNLYAHFPFKKLFLVCKEKHFRKSGTEIKVNTRLVVYEIYFITVYPFVGKFNYQR